MGHRTSPGCGNMQHCILYLCFLKSFLQSGLLPPTFRACAPLMQVPYVAECPWEGLGYTRHLHEWGASSEVGATICHVECITLSFLTFSSLGRTLSESWMALQ
jgi:hypothetical protein